MRARSAEQFVRKLASDGKMLPHALAFESEIQRKRHSGQELDAQSFHPSTMVLVAARVSYREAPVRTARVATP